MNRGLPTLILLLGTLGGSIVALGVARDLQRAEEPTSKFTTTVTPFSRTPTVGGVVLRSAALRSPVYAIPLPRYAANYELTLSSRDAVSKLLCYRAELQLPPTMRAGRVIDDRSFVRELAGAQAADTRGVDALIAANDGIVEKTDADEVPYGFVAVGRERTLVRLEQRPTDAVSLAWSGALHYGGTPHGLLDPMVGRQVPTTQRVARLPWDPVRLWSSERVRLQQLLERFAARAAGLSPVLFRETARAAAGLEWVNRRIDAGFNTLAVQVKRELWLATMPALPDDLRSAELPQPGKR